MARGIVRVDRITVPPEKGAPAVFQITYDDGSTESVIAWNKEDARSRAGG